MKPDANLNDVKDLGFDQTLLFFLKAEVMHLYCRHGAEFGGGNWYGTLIHRYNPRGEFKLIS